VASVGNGGTVCVPSVHPGTTEFDIRTITRRAISVKGSLGYTRDAWVRTVRMIADGTYRADRIVTSQITRDQIMSDGFEALTDPDRGQLKILVRVND
jgi:(R,R)-butanediol dehydrogenase/meso-butanediol dehydrogenase/diacetyl reductase